MGHHVIVWVRTGASRSSVMTYGNRWGMHTMAAKGDARRIAIMIRLIRK
jgi:hypothetical protein